MKKSILFLLFFIANSCTVYGKEISFQDALSGYSELNLKMPIAETDGRIQTFNRKGATSPSLDYATLSFIEFAQNKKVLEVGGAYGLVMSNVLAKYPQTTYHINDLDERHLYIAADYLLNNQKISNNILGNNTKFISGNFIKEDIKDKYDAILIARVLHFMTPKELDKAISKLHATLKPGGRIYSIAITPYVKRYQKFISEYEKRVSENHPYPGYVSSLYDWLNEDATSHQQQKQISNQPFMFLDDIVLTKLFEQKGFKIIECKTQGLGYHSDSWSLDERENVVLIAEKVEI